MAQSSALKFLAGLSGGASVNLNDENSVFAARMANLINDAEAATGAQVQVTYGYRSPEQSAQIKANHTGKAVTYGGRTYKPQGSPRNTPAATPGNSMHNFGAAMDIMPSGKAYKWMTENAPKYGVQWGGTFSDPDLPHFQLPRAELSAMRDGSLPMPPQTDLPGVGTELAFAPTPPQPGTLNSALQAIQASTAPSNWADFYQGILPQPQQTNDFAQQIDSPEAASAWYSNFGLPPAGSPPSIPTITTPQQASDFYSNFGLPPAAPPTPQSQTAQDASNFYQGFGLPSAPAAPTAPDAPPQIRTAQDAANFYAGFGLTPPSLPQVASADNSVPRSILPQSWPSIPAPPPSLTSEAPAAEPPSISRTNGTEYLRPDGSSIYTFEPRSVALPDGARPSVNVPTISPDSLPPKDNGGPLSGLFGSSIPDTLTAPSLDVATAFGAGPRTGDSFNAGSPPSALPSNWPSIAPPSMNAVNTVPGADLASLSVPQSAAPTYQTVTKYRTVSQQVPIEQGDGVTWNPDLGNYELSAPQYQTATKQVPYTVKVPIPAPNPAQVPAMPAPVFPASPPEGELAGLREQQLNPLQRLFNMTPAGHVFNFLNGSASAYGAPQTGGVLQAIARANGSNPLATLFGGGGAPAPQPSALLATLTGAQRAQSAPGLLAALGQNQAGYIPAAGAGMVPTTTIGGGWRRSDSDAALGLGNSLTENGFNW